jgi:antitoxin component YwqK of YwqJK toxin-antitoxin module
LNGKINVKVPYVNGKCHGLETTYSVEGNLIAEINYYEGIRHGSCSYYDSKGDIIDIYLYQNGNIVKY